MSVKYGLPYKGSKNALVEKIFALFPNKSNFYDLFCGGGSMSHYALLNNCKVYMNDIEPMITELFYNVVIGKYHNEKRWISREDFNSLKSTDPYVRYVWSFGNNGRDYIYGREIEPLKKALHYAIVFNDFSMIKEIDPNFDENIVSENDDLHERRLKICSCFNKRQQNLINCERLQCLERLESLERLHISNVSYDEVPISNDSVIYCDIPYINTNSYDSKSSTRNDFNYEKFYDWCFKQKEPLFVSSYYMPEDRFIEMESFSHNCGISIGSKKVTERVFVPIHQKDMLSYYDAEKDIFSI